MDQLEDNLGAASLHLSAEELSKLEQVSKVEKGYPYRFIEAFAPRA
jgi:aryl-alcohol dehydrogenase-like predicted oxidoreductase